MCVRALSFARAGTYVEVGVDCDHALLAHMLNAHMLNACCPFYRPPSSLLTPSSILSLFLPPSSSLSLSPLSFSLFLVASLSFFCGERFPRVFFLRKFQNMNDRNIIIFIVCTQVQHKTERERVNYRFFFHFLSIIEFFVHCVHRPTTRWIESESARYKFSKKLDVAGLENYIGYSSFCNRSLLTL
jgi:hypothetical protein